MINKIARSVALSLILFASPALAQLAPPQPKTQNGVTFVSGGVDSDNMKAMHEIAKNYNVQLLFAGKGSGEYLADVQVRLVGAHEKPIIDTLADGPYFLAQLEPGRYQLTATYNNQPIQEVIEVPAHGAAAKTIYWAPQQ
ncbi:MAG: hypothetical protein P4M00_00790 [Azospirillaceae bacterium]|nr:hypothetical protein [Azospirillaceae bacterium]